MAMDTIVRPCSTEDLASPELVLTLALVLPARCCVEHLTRSMNDAMERFPSASARVLRTGKVFSFLTTADGPAVRPVCRYTGVEISATLSESKLELPPRTHRSEDVPTFLPAYPLAHHFRGPGCPTSLKDFLVPGTPLLHVHFALYDDTTLIGVTTSHLAFDAHGLKLVLAGWAASTRGCLSSVVASTASFSPLSFEEKVKRAYSDITLSKNQPRRGWHALGLLASIHFVVLYIWALLVDRKERSVFIRIPSSWIDRQKFAAMLELGSRHGGEFVSRNDIICAWLLKMTHAHRTDSTPVTPHMTINLRALLPDVFIAPYIHNAVGTVASSPLPAHMLASQPLVDTALYLRCSLEGFKRDIPRLHAELLDAAHHPGRTLFPCRPGGQFVVLTSWLSASFGDLAFAPSPGGQPVSPTWVMAFTQDLPPVPMRSVAAIVAETKGAVWVRWAMGQKAFDRMKAAALAAGCDAEFVGFGE